MPTANTVTSLADRPLALVYVPGLGDERVAGQQLAINTWRYWGVEPVLCRLGWSDNESWAAKFDHLLAMIDDLQAQGKAVGLVGASAGAAAVIQAFAARKDQVAACVLIAGKVNRPETIGAYHYQHNPAFVEAAYGCPAALATFSAGERRRILSRYALADGVVHRLDSRILGARNHVVLSLGHAFTIGSQLVLGAPGPFGFIRFVRRVAGNVA